MEQVKKSEEELISCVCLTCGVRNDHSHPDGYCQNGHDDWLEFRDFAPEGEFFGSDTVKRAQLLTGLSLEELEKQFMDNTVKQFYFVECLEIDQK